MKTFQPSFASGEISPLLHARIDLAKYATGLAELRNMIVLPQGGITRRPGFTMGDINGLGSWYSTAARLIPFTYNKTDSVMLELGNKTARVWVKSGGKAKAIASFATPYDVADVQALRYVQSGNVIFMAHKKYKPQMLTRKSLTSWSFAELDYQGGPWIDGTDWAPGVELTLAKVVSFTGKKGIRIHTQNNAALFDSSLVGSLLKVEYAVNGRTSAFNSNGAAMVYSDEFEVKGNKNSY